MPALLPDSKKIFSMGCTLRGSIRRVRNLSELPPPPPPPPPTRSGESLRGRAPYSVPSSFRFLDQHRLDQRQRPSTEPSLLLQLSSEGSRGEVSKDGETNPGISNHSPKTPPLLPSTYDRNPNRIPDEVGPT